METACQLTCSQSSTQTHSHDEHRPLPSPSLHHPPPALGHLLAKMAPAAILQPRFRRELMMEFQAGLGLSEADRNPSLAYFYFLTLETESTLVSKGPRFVVILSAERLPPALNQATPPYSQLGLRSLMLRCLAEEAPGLRPALGRRPSTSNKSQIKTLKSMTTKEKSAQTLTSCLSKPTT